MMVQEDPIPAAKPQAPTNNGTPTTTAPVYARTHIMRSHTEDLHTDPTVFTEFGFRTNTRSRTSSLPNQPSFLSTIFSPPSSSEEQLREDQKQFSSMGQNVHTNTKKFWMSDKNCYACDDCGAAFHTFRRRHHCRLCGRIFCDKCSSKTMDGNRYGFQGHIRVCNYCHRLAEKNQENEAEAEVVQSPRLPDVFPPGDRKTDDEVDAFGMSESTYSDEGLSWRNNNRRGSSDSESGSDSETESHVHEPIAECHHEFDTAAERIHHLHHECKDATTPTTAPQSPTSRYNKEEKSEEGKSNRSQQIMMLSQVPEDLAEVTLHQKRIQEVHKKHLCRVVDKMLEIEQLDPAWKDIIVKFALQATEKVQPQVPLGDHMDIRHYVKVKKIAGGSPSDCRYVDGVVFRKNIAHRKMRTRIENPKILLLSCALEYQRVMNRLSSLDVLLSQEEEYINILVAKILALKPDIVIVQRTVSRLAQKRLRAENVTLVLNVDASLMERIARSTKGIILSTTDHADSQPKEKTLGTCQTFRIELFQEDLRGKKRRQTPLMFFEGCNTNLHCTIYLRGDSREVLQRVKAVMKQAVHVAYNLSLEAAFMNDQRATYVGVNELEETPISLKSSSPFLDFPLPAKRQDSAKNSRYRYQQTRRHDNQWPHPGEAANQWLHQKLVFGSCWLMNSWQCFPPELKGIEFYTAKDKTLGEILVENCFDIKSRCVNHKCKKTILQHVLSYNHYHGRVIIRVTRLPASLPRLDEKILMWSRCQECTQTVTPVVPMSDKTASFSFGKFLELTFYNHSIRCRIGNCGHSIHNNHIRFFGQGDVVVSFEYQTINPYKVCRSLDLRNKMNLTTDRHIEERDLVANVSRYMFAAFLWKIGELEEVCSNNVTTAEQDAKSHAQLAELHNLKEIISNESKTFEGLITDESHEGNIMWFNQLRRRLFICAQMWNQALPTIYRMRSYDQPSHMSALGISQSPSVPASAVPARLRANTSRSAPSSPKLKPERERVRRPSGGSFDDSILSDAFQRSKSKRSSIDSAALGSVAKAAAAAVAAMDISSISENPGDSDDDTITEMDLGETFVEEEKVNGNSELEESKESRTRGIEGVVDLGNSEENQDQVGKSQLEEEVVEEQKEGEPAPAVLDLEPVQIGEQPEGLPPLVCEDDSGAMRVSSPKAPGEPQLGEHPLPNGSEHSQFGSSQSLGNQQPPGSQPPEKLPVIQEVPQKKAFDAQGRPPPPTRPPPPELVAQYSNKKDPNDEQPGKLSTPLAEVADRAVSPQLSKRHSKDWSPQVELDNITKVNEEWKDENRDIYSDSDFLDASTGHGHFSLPTGVNNMVVPVYSDEPSSIIAYTLCSKQHKSRLGDLYTDNGAKLPPEVIRETMVIPDDTKLEFEFKDLGFQTQSNNKLSNTIPSISSAVSLPFLSASLPNSPSESPKQSSDPSQHEFSKPPTPLQLNEPVSQDYSSVIVNKSPTTQLSRSQSLQAVRRSTSPESQLPQRYDTPQLFPMPPFPPTPEIVRNSPPKIDVTSFQCTAYFPKQFYALRQHYCGGDEKYVESLSRSLKWIATGGKSGSTFSKTLDDRFILKYISGKEFRMLLDRAKDYLLYMQKAFFQKLPTVLVPTLGIYEVSCKSPRYGKKMTPKNVVVMPNLFYAQTISRVFDLKGSVRNRYIKDANDDIVLLDENFMEFTQGFPIPFDDSSKELLRVSVFNDTLFLCSLEIVDYSILVGIDDSNADKPQLIVGVIDYNREYTWDKVLETAVKTGVGVVAGRATPTVVSPKNYKERFRMAMDRYFMVAPDRHTKMAANENDFGK